MYYTAKELVTRVKQLDSYKNIPEGYWLCAIRKAPEEQKPNEFNDIVYLMKGIEIVMDAACTTVPGLPALKGGFKKYNKNGAAVIKADIFYYDVYGYGLHSGKMPALRQKGKMFYHRDGDLDSMAEEIGPTYNQNAYTNFHAATYKAGNAVIQKWIGHWSYGCIVAPNRIEYDKIISTVKNQHRVSMVILNEFGV